MVTRTVTPEKRFRCRACGEYHEEKVTRCRFCGAEGEDLKLMSRRQSRAASNWLWGRAEKLGLHDPK